MRGLIGDVGDMSGIMSRPFSMRGNVICVGAEGVLCELCNFIKR